MAAESNSEKWLDTALKDIEEDGELEFEKRLKKNVNLAKIFIVMYHKLKKDNKAYFIIPKIIKVLPHDRSFVRDLLNIFVVGQILMKIKTPGKPTKYVPLFDDNDEKPRILNEKWLEIAMKTLKMKKK